MAERRERRSQELPFRHLLREYPTLRAALVEFERVHGADWADLVLVLLHDLARVRFPDRFEIGFSFLDAQLKDDKKAFRSAMAKTAALVAHAEHHAMKQQVFEWLEVNMRNFRSMDAAAEAIAGKLVPVTFRTVRGWIGEWKKQHPAGKP